MRLLTANEIDVKVKQINDNGCLLLLYKTARVDMAMLDEKYGPSNWQCDYKTINGVLYCGIGILRVDNGQPSWVWKWDCGIESRDNDGQEKKGEASDAFKRAGFKWGIGRELYTAPFIWANVPTKAVEDKKTGKTVWQLADRYMRFEVAAIEYDEKSNIKKLDIKTDKGQLVFSMDKRVPALKTQAKTAPKTDPVISQANMLADKKLIASAQDLAELDQAMHMIKAKRGEAAFKEMRSQYVMAYNQRKAVITGAAK